MLLVITALSSFLVLVENRYFYDGAIEHKLKTLISVDRCPGRSKSSLSGAHSDLLLLSRSGT